MSTRLTSYTFSTAEYMLPAGPYAVIDPGYVFTSDPFWGDMCDFMETHVDNQTGYLNIQIDGLTAYAFTTAYGDGVYPVFSSGADIGSAGVDARILSLIPLALIEKYGSREQVDRFGVLVVLEHPSVPSYCDGDVTCGNLFIRTTDSDDDEGGYIYGSSPEDNEEEE